MTTSTSDAGATSAKQEAMPPGAELLDLEQYLPPMDPGVSMRTCACGGRAWLGRY